MYDRLWKARGLTPLQCDDLALWHIGIMLGCSEELREKTPTQGATRPAREDHHAVNRRLIRQRLAHAKGLGPMPEAPGVSMETLGSMASALGG